MTTNDASSWMRLSSAVAYNGYVQVTRDRLRAPDGTEDDWDIISGPDSVAVLAFSSDGAFFLTFEQFRPGPFRSLREIPGGYIAEAESPTSAAIRELREETGYTAGAVFEAGAEWFAANSTRRKHLVIASLEAPGGTQWDPRESGIVRLEPVERLLPLVRSGELTDAGTAARGILTLVASAEAPPELRSIRDRLRTELLPRSR